MTRSARVRAQAKINLSLRVLAREVSGYHQIETVFQRLDLADDVWLDLTEGSRSLYCAGPMLPPSGLGVEHENLAWRAADAYLRAVGSSKGFRIEVIKHIPSGGGLGGGSADAGAVLRLMHVLHGGLTDDRLLQLASTIGADVPFLTQAESTVALAWGRGDRMLGLPPLPDAWCLLAVAPFGVNTASAYGWLAERSGTSPGPSWLPRAAFASWAELAESVNDFEDVVFPRHPQLAEAFEALRKGVKATALVRMSGSGSTLYALGEGADAAPAAISGLPPGFLLVPTRVASTVSAIELR